MVRYTHSRHSTFFSAEDEGVTFQDYGFTVRSLKTALPDLTSIEAELVVRSAGAWVRAEQTRLGRFIPSEFRSGDELRFCAGKYLRLAELKRTEPTRFNAIAAGDHDFVFCATKVTVIALASGETSVYAPSPRNGKPYGSILVACYRSSAADKLNHAPRTKEEHTMNMVDAYIHGAPVEGIIAKLLR